MLYNKYKKVNPFKPFFSCALMVYGQCYSHLLALIFSPSWYCHHLEENLLRIIHLRTENCGNHNNVTASDYLTEIFWSRLPITSSPSPSTVLSSSFPVICFCTNESVWELSHLCKFSRLNQHFWRGLFAVQQRAKFLTSSLSFRSRQEGLFQEKKLSKFMRWALNFLVSRITTPVYLSSLFSEAVAVDVESPPNVR